MGNCNFTTGETSATNQLTEKQISRNHFKFIKIVGRGGFGKVWKIKKKSNDQKMAIKVMSKVLILQKNSISSVLNEQKILSMVNHP